MIHFINISPGDPLPVDATMHPRNDRRRLAAALRHLCPELTAEEATALSLKPGPGTPADINVDRCKDLILRELPAIRAAKQGPPPGDLWNDDGTHWDDPVDPWPHDP